MKKDPDRGSRIFKSLTEKDHVLTPDAMLEYFVKIDDGKDGRDISRRLKESILILLMM